MKELDNIEIRSEEVQEILGTPPSWMVRWGSLTAFAIFVLLMWLSFLVKYPDVIEDDIRLISKDPPVTLSAPNAIRIEEVVVTNDRQVDSGQVLIAFRSTANFRHVLTLENYIDNLRGEKDQDLLSLKAPSNLVLGEIQADLVEFQDAQRKYFSDVYQNLSTFDLRSSQIRISSLDRSLEYQKEVRQRIKEQISEAEQDRKNKEYQVSINQASQEDVNKVLRRVMDLTKELARSESEIRDRESELSALRIKVRSIERGADNGNVASDVLQETFKRLKASLTTWKQQYLLESPTKGMVQIVGRNVTSNVFVNKNEPLITIIPQARQEKIGKMFIPFERSGRVKVGQKVIVQLESLDFQEYGVLEGEVSWRSLTPRDDPNNDQKSELPIDVRFPDGLITTAGKSIVTDEILLGKARIITEERRFIERIFSGVSRYRSNFGE